MDDYTYLSALDALVATRPMLDPRNYGDMTSYRHDQRRNARDAADYRTLRLYVKPTNDELHEAARGSRIMFASEFGGGCAVDYCAGQYYPVEYRAACVRLLARVWWDCLTEAFPAFTADEMRAHARHTFGRAFARRWFN